MFINPAVNKFIFGEIKPFLKDAFPFFKDGEITQNDEASKLNLPLEKCVAGYSSRQGMEKIGYLLYRIWNAVKAIFNQSDWQKLKKETNDFLLRIKKNPSTPEGKEFKTQINNLYIQIFEVFILGNGKRSEEEADSVMKEKFTSFANEKTQILEKYLG